MEGTAENRMEQKTRLEWREENGKSGCFDERWFLSGLIMTVEANKVENKVESLPV